MPSAMPSIRIGDGEHQHVAVEGDELADGDRPVDRLAAADEQDRRQAELGQEADERVVEGAQPGRDHRLVEHALHGAVGSASAGAASCANALTTRTPETFSSASAVSSAIRCCTSWRRRPVRAAVARTPTQITNGIGASATSASTGLTTSITAAAITIVSADWSDEDQPVAEEEADRLEVDRRARHQLAGLLGVEERRARATGGAPYMRLRRSNSTPSETRPATSRRTTLKTSRSSAGAGDRQRERPEVRAVPADLVDRAADQERDQDARAHRDGREHERPDDARAGTGAGSRAVARRCASAHYFT